MLLLKTENEQKQFILKAGNKTGEMRSFKVIAMQVITWGSFQKIIETYVL